MVQMKIELCIEVIHEEYTHITFGVSHKTTNERDSQTERNRVGQRGQNTK